MERQFFSKAEPLQMPCHDPFHAILVPLIFRLQIDGERRRPGYQRDVGIGQSDLAVRVVELYCVLMRPMEAKLS